jgi:hypothetical protein
MASIWVRGGKADVERARAGCWLSGECGDGTGGWELLDGPI